MGKDSKGLASFHLKLTIDHIERKKKTEEINWRQQQKIQVLFFFLISPNHKTKIPKQYIHFLPQSQWHHLKTQERKWLKCIWGKYLSIFLVSKPLWKFLLRKSLHLRVGKWRQFFLSSSESVLVKKKWSSKQVWDEIGWPSQKANEIPKTQKLGKLRQADL